MANDLDNAISRVQQIALATSLSSTDASVKSAPDYPIENIDPLPMAISYLGGGEFNMVSATMHKNFPTIHVEFHFSRMSLKYAYQDINAVALDFPARLADDPTLNGNVQTILAGRDTPIGYTVRPFDWGKVVTQMMLFVIPVKLLNTPVETST